MSGVARRPACFAIAFAFVLALNVDAQPVFSSAFTVNNNALPDDAADYDPSVATDNNGHWVAVWYSNNLFGKAVGDPDIVFTRSSDNGNHWTNIARLNTNGASDDVGDFSPVIATDGEGVWITVWQTFDTLGDTIGLDADILFSRSTDNGATWSTATPLNTNATTDSGRDENAVLAVDGDGNWICIWYSNDTLGNSIGSDYDILYSRSTNGGVTWSAPAALNTNAATDSGDDSYCSIATDKTGNWVAVWESEENLGGTIETDKDIFVSRSTNAGQSWTAPAILNTNAADDGGADEKPFVLSDGGGTWVCVWQTTDTLGNTIGGEGDIAFARSGDNGATWTAIAALNMNATDDDGLDRTPVVATDGAGNWVCVYDSDSEGDGSLGQDYDIWYSYSNDDGSTWDGPTQLLANADSDNNTDKKPVVVADLDANWVILWSSDNHITQNSGPDPDIYACVTGEGSNLATITVTNPNGGEKWKTGKRSTIEWESTGDGGNKVKIELLRNGSFVQNIKAATNNDGKQKWKVPNSLQKGKGYKVRVSSVSNGSIVDTSDGNFRVK